MLVGRGSLTFRAYMVSGKNAQPEIKTICSRLDKMKFSGLGDSDEGSVSGWIAPDHLFDGEFEETKVSQGPYACFALRIDSRKVPSSLLNAHCALEEKAAREAQGVDKLAGGERRRIKRDVKARLLAETPPSQKAFGVIWRVRSKKLFFQSTSKGPNQELIELFAKTFDLELVPVLPGGVADDVAKEKELEAGLAQLEPMTLNVSTKKSAAKQPATVEA